MTYSFETTVVGLALEDSGMHLVAYGLSDVEEAEAPCPLYVHLLSAAENPDDPDAHAALRGLEGKRIRITIDVVD